MKRPEGEKESGFDHQATQEGGEMLAEGPQAREVFGDYHGKELIDIGILGHASSPFSTVSAAAR